MHYLKSIPKSRGSQHQRAGGVLWKVSFTYKSSGVVESHSFEEQPETRSHPESQLIVEEGNPRKGLTGGM